MSNSLLNLRRRDLRVIDLSNYNFIGANLEGANLRKKNLTGKNLTGAKLVNAKLEKAKLSKAILSNTTSTNANFTDANLTEAKLQESFLFKANFTNATLIKANLKGAYLSTTIFKKANLKEADLEGANLTRADLKEADLTGANLTGANLIGAILTGAILSGVILSEIQKKQIIRESENIQIISQSFSFRLPRNSGYLINNQIVAQRPRRELESLLIKIPKEILNLQNSANSSCPNYNDLYDFILDQDLTLGFEFRYIGQLVIDEGGARRDIFDKILPVYTHRFFESIESNNDCVILKINIDMEIFIEETLQMILLAKAANIPIFLKIHEKLLSLLSSEIYKEYFNNNKEIFKKLYENVSLYINTNNNSYNILEDNSAFLRNKNNNDIINRYKKEKNKDIRNKLRKEIRLRKFLVGIGFKTWKQFENMHYFIKNIVELHKNYFSFKLDFHLESFLKKIKIKKEYEGEIPLTNFGVLSDDKTTFEFKESNIYSEYEYFRPFLDYIIGPKSNNLRRAMCIAYITGSSYYPGSFTFVLQYASNPKPFFARTCKFECLFFKNDKNRVFYENKEHFIEDQLKPKPGNDFSFH
jgi:uncharacterized protein YjbI with pentapeptide repeats